MKKDKVLFITWRYPFPLISGAEIRIFNNLKILSEQYEVDMLVITDLTIKEEDINILKKYCTNIKIYSYSKHKFYLNLCKNIFSTDPLQCNYYYFREVEKWININKKNYKKFFFNHIRTSKYIKSLNKEDIIIDFVDAISMNFKNGEKNVKGLKKIIYKIENKRLLNYEKVIAEKIDKIFIISQVDKNYLLSNGIKDNIKVLGNFVTLDFDKNYIMDKQKKNIKYLLFLGKMNYEPNISAVKYFSREIFPQIKKCYPEIEFWIAGNCPTDEVKRLEIISGVKVLGFVNSRIDIIKNCELFVAPMISGSGIQNKILEAMYLGKVVITTEIGEEGLEKLVGNEIVVCKTTDEIINNTIRLLNNKSERSEIESRAQIYINKIYSYQAILKKMLTLLEGEENL